MNRRSGHVQGLILPPLFAVVIGICSILSIPLTIPITLQIFAVFFTIEMIGPLKGTVSILLYLFLGLLGLPVFSSGTGGIGVLFGHRGGYLIGLLLCGICAVLLKKLLRRRKLKYVVYIISLGICYLAGTLWYGMYVWSAGQSVGILFLFSTCVLPFIPLDIIKMILAVKCAELLKKALKSDAGGALTK